MGISLLCPIAIFPAESVFAGLEAKAKRDLCSAINRVVDVFSGEECCSRQGKDGKQIRTILRRNEMKTHRKGIVDFVNLRTWDVPAFVFAVCTIVLGPGLPMTAAQ